MFYARVMIGTTVKCQADKNMRIPPPINQENPNDLYDSVQGHTGGSDVFMIYTNKQAYPEYLITYSWADWHLRNRSFFIKNYSIVII